jgi:4-amino-4-deoxy-L-arabinose transferase-like glycosyltransferase
VTRLVFVLALLVRVAVIAMTGFKSTSFGDAEAYMRTAELVLETKSYPDNAEALPVFRAPGYPSFLIVSTLGHPRAVPVDKLWNALLGAACAVLLARIAGRISGSSQVALAAGLLAAVNPAFVYLATDVQSESLTILLLLLFASQLLAAVDGGRARDALGAGVFLGLAALTRPSCLALAPLLLTPLATRRLGARLGRGAAAVAGLAIALAPWTVRNATRFGAFLPVNDQAGVVFWLGNTQINVDFYALKTREEFRGFTDKYKADVDHGRIRQIAAGYQNPAARSRAFLADALSWIRRNPRDWARLLGEKTLDWLRPWASRFEWSRPVVVATGLWYGALFVLAGVGLARFRRPGLSSAATAILLLSAAAHVATLVVWRYRMVFWDPVLIVYAAAGGEAVIRPLLSGRMSEGPPLSRQAPQ